jgi:hypothetical protein
MNWTSIAVLFLFVTACGPSLSTQTLNAFPARAPRCDVKIEKLTPAEVEGLDTIYVVAGVVAVSDFETKDPYSEEVLALIRPAVCRLGGDAVSLARQKTGADGATTAYYALHRKEPDPNGGAPPLLK